MLDPFSSVYPDTRFHPFAVPGSWRNGCSSDGGPVRSVFRFRVSLHNVHINETTVPTLPARAETSPHLQQRQQQQQQGSASREYAHLVVAVTQQHNVPAVKHIG